jgi:hypothetical protein
MKGIEICKEGAETTSASKKVIIDKSTKKSQFTKKIKKIPELVHLKHQSLFPLLVPFFFAHLVSTFLSCFIDSLVCLHLLIFFLFVF